jgi:hypothetical protein
MDSLDGLEGFIQQESARDHDLEEFQGELRTQYLECINRSLNAVKTIGIILTPESSDEYLTTRMMEEWDSGKPLEELDLIEGARIPFNLVKKVLTAVTGDFYLYEEDINEAVRQVNINTDTTTREKLHWIRAIEIATGRVILTDDDEVNMVVLDATRKSDRLTETITSYRDAVIEDSIKTLYQEITEQFGEHDSARKIAELMVTLPYRVSQYEDSTGEDETDLESFVNMRLIMLQDMSDSYIPKDMLRYYIVKTSEAMKGFETVIKVAENGQEDED